MEIKQLEIQRQKEKRENVEAFIRMRQMRENEEQQNELDVTFQPDDEEKANQNSDKTHQIEQPPQNDSKSKQEFNPFTNNMKANIHMADNQE